MQPNSLSPKSVRAYLILTSIAVCGLLASVVSAPKIIHWGIDFPFATILFSIFTYPITDCICELWGKQMARQALWIGIGCQLLFTLLLQWSIAAPHASFWKLQNEYDLILNAGALVVIGSSIAFFTSQLLDIFVYQKIKNKTNGKLLWLRSNLSMYMGQMIDSCIFILIVFHASDHKFRILFGAIILKIIISFLTTPMIYLIVIAVNRYLDSDTLAFKPELSKA